jgi:hypothetical protein
MDDDIRVSSPETLMKGLRIRGSLVGNRFVTYAVTP